jgi:uncharacterized protein YdbL (DUF1318 family)
MNKTINQNHGPVAGWNKTIVHRHFSKSMGAAIGLFCLAAMMAGCSNDPSDGRSEGADAWKNLRGTHECFPFHLENGEGFEYEGKNYDDPCSPVVSRTDWVVSDQGRTFVLYDVNPGDLEPGIFHKQYHESLWIALVDAEGNVQRKIKLATGVKDISGVQRGSGGAHFVSATGVSGEKTNIALRFPEPWPPLEPTGDAWEDFQKRKARKYDELEEDWPGNGSGMAADWMSLRLEEWLDGEYDRVMTAVEKLARNEEEAKQVREGRFTAYALIAEKDACEDQDVANVHWGNTMDRVDREQYLQPFFQNWVEAIEHPDGWAAVNNARGSFRGEDFQATNGVAILGAPDWIKNSEHSDCYHRLLRLAPARVREEGGKVHVGFDIIDPWVMDSGWLAGKGEFVLENGELREP